MKLSEEMRDIWKMDWANHLTTDMFGSWIERIAELEAENTKWRSEHTALKMEYKNVETERDELRAEVERLRNLPWIYQQINEALRNEQKPFATNRRKAMTRDEIIEQIAADYHVNTGYVLNLLRDREILRSFDSLNVAEPTRGPGKSTSENTNHG